MKTSEHLKSAKKLIENEQNWIKNTYALDAEDNEVDYADKKACKFCSFGALQRIGLNFFEMEAAHDVLLKAVRSKDPTILKVSVYNDNHSHEEVMNMWDVAINMAEEYENNL